MNQLREINQKLDKIIGFLEKKSSVTKKNQKLNETHHPIISVDWTATNLKMTDISGTD